MWVQTVDGPRLESYELGFLATDQSEVLPVIETYLKAFVLLKTAEKARETASKAWDDALLPLDRKLALYTSDLRQQSAGNTRPCPSARAEFLALVKCTSYVPFSMLILGKAWCGWIGDWTLS
jgi:hypothetical protein